MTDSESQPNNNSETLNWTTEQEMIFSHRNGPLQVIACAGSGKTTTISRMISEMIKAGADRDSIVAITFTENAAKQLKVNIKSQLEEFYPENPNLNNMFVGTIHKFCKEILNEFDPNKITYEILNEQSLAAFILQHFNEIRINELEPRVRGAKIKKIKYFIDDANTARRENLIELLNNSNDETNKAFANSLRIFRQLINTHHFFDFEELIFRTNELLKNNTDFLNKVRQKYQYIIVDEYQDVDNSQNRLIRTIAEPRNNLVVVGDDDQSIYRWRGTNVTNFIRFGTDYGIKPLTLGRNYRSTDIIVDLSRNLIENNNNRLDKAMVAGCPTNHCYGELGDVYCCYFNHLDEEIDFIYNKIVSLVGTVYTDVKGKSKTISYGDIAIFFRKKRDSQELIRRFDLEGFRDYIVTGEESLFSSPESDFIRYAFAYIAGGIREEIEIYNLVGDRDQYNNPGLISVDEIRLREAIDRSNIISERADGIINGLNQLRSWFNNPTSRRIYPQKIFYKILGFMGIKDIEYPERLMYSFGQISILLKDFETVYRLIYPDKIINLVEYLNWAAINVDMKIDDPTLLNAVRIMTVHSAKGLEFPIVFMPSLSKRGFPNTPIISLSWARPDNSRWLNHIFDYSSLEEREEEARRLFYVGITRSQKYLFMTGSLRSPGYINRTNPSIFFNEIINQNDEKVLTEPDPDPTARQRKEIGSIHFDLVYETSFSQLRYMSHCPFDFKLKHVYGFCPHIDSSFNYGFAVHNTIRLIHQNYLDIWPPRLPTNDEIEELIRDPEQFHLRYAGGTVERNLRSSAIRIISDYVNNYGETIQMAYRPEVPFEHLIRDNRTNTRILVTGTIDLLERTDPKTNRILDVNVIDFKTEHDKNDEYHPSYRDAKYQVRLYAIATQSQFGIGTSEGYIHYLSDNVRKQVELDELHLRQVEFDVKNKVNNILNRQFNPISDIERCASCDRRDICIYCT